MGQSLGRGFHIVLGTVTAFVFILIYGPLLVPILLSFFPFEGSQIVWAKPSVDAYKSLMENDAIIKAIQTTLVVSGATIVLSVLLSLLAALLYLGRNQLRWEVMQFIIFMPFVMPPIITGLSLLIFFKELGISRSLYTVIAGHTIFVLAVVYRIILQRLSALPRNLWEASMDLGASRIQTFFYIILPNLFSSIMGAAVLAFVLSFDETMITLLLTGTDSTLPVHLWSLMRMGFTPDINALVTMIFMISALASLATLKFTQRR